jgi:hypothetical protein
MPAMIISGLGCWVVSAGMLGGVMEPSFATAYENVISRHPRNVVMGFLTIEDGRNDNNFGSEEGTTIPSEMSSSTINLLPRGTFVYKETSKVHDT